MKYVLGDKVKVLSGIYFKGHNLTGKIGVVKDTRFYVLVYFSDLDETIKMLSHEIEYYPDFEDSYYKSEW